MSTMIDGVLEVSKRDLGKMGRGKKRERKAN